jgi:hypothetical protein
MQIVVVLVAIGFLAGMIFLVRQTLHEISRTSLKSAYGVRTFCRITGIVTTVVCGILTAAAPSPVPIPAPWMYELGVFLALTIGGIILVVRNMGAPRAALLRYAEQAGVVTPKDLMNLVGLKEAKAIRHLEEMVGAGMLARKDGEGVFTAYVVAAGRTTTP